MSEYKNCCGTTADKKKLAEEFQEQKLVISAQQRRIADLLSVIETLSGSEPVAWQQNGFITANADTAQMWRNKGHRVTELYEMRRDAEFPAGTIISEVV